MAEHLLGNVYQVGGGSITHELDGASYLILDTEKQQHALIDCGSPLGYGELTRQLEMFNIEIGRIAVVYATHGHFDHIAADTYMPESPLYVHANDIEAIVASDPLKTATFLYDSENFPGISRLEPIAEGYEIAIGKTALSVIDTPGHSPGSVSYKLKTEEGTLLIAGDALWGCYHYYMGSDLDEWDNSLYRLAQDNFDYVSFGHGASKLIPNAMNHIKNARSIFCKDIQLADNGLFLDPWAAVWNNNSSSVNY